jgi:hypothetical protein
LSIDCPIEIIQLWVLIIPLKSFHVLRKVFIGGIGPEIVEADLKAYFDTMGEITDIVVMKGEHQRKYRLFSISFVVVCLWLFHLQTKLLEMEGALDLLLSQIVRVIISEIPITWLSHLHQAFSIERRHTLLR